MIRPKQAKKVLPKSEFERFEGVIQNQIRRTSAKTLKTNASASRRLRNKYRDLARREKAEAKRSAGDQSTSNHNELRAEIYQEILGRIEGELERRPRN